ncbi:MAG: hypothetical protein ACO1RX_12395 [Candidatus Sericytochromatia bacterium]
MTSLPRPLNTGLPTGFSLATAARQQPVPPVSTPPAAPPAPVLMGLEQMLQQRGFSGWHLKLSQGSDKSQAENLLKNYAAHLTARPEALAQLAQLPHGQALIESLEAAGQGQLSDQHVRAIQHFLSQTAGIDISYGSSRGVDGLMGPRTLNGLKTLFERLEQGGTVEASTAYLSSLELAERDGQTPVLTSLSLFSDSPSGQMYERSPYHDESKFVPRFAMTAYHESGSYRKPSDPYAVGTITRPRKRDDLGGKTYGTYQFESSVYPDGSRRDGAQNSTLMRFIRWSGNPMGPQLRAAAEQHGVATPAFDRVWTQLAQQQNKIFGEAQQQFLLHERASSVDRFVTRAGLSATVSQDPRIVDLIMGTTNHVGGLANSAADHLAQMQHQMGRPLTVNEAGKAIAEYKETKIAAWFQSSPGAWDGLRNRFNDEGSQFA